MLDVIFNVLQILEIVSLNTKNALKTEPSGSPTCWNYFN